MKKKKNLFQKVEKWLGNRTSLFLIVVAVFIQSIFFFFISLNNVYTETYDLQRFATANTTIRSPVTIENEVETERKTREAVQQIGDRYSISEQVNNERIGYSEEIFDAVLSLNDESDKTKDKDKQVKEGESEEEAAELSTEEKIDRLRQVLSEEIVLEASADSFRALINQPREEIEKAKKLFITSVKEVMEEGVRTENLQSARVIVEDEIKYSELDPVLKDALIEFANFIVTENSFFDLEATNEARKIAASNVDPEMIKAGEIIVSEGQVITNEIYEQLQLVGLLDGERNFYPVIGLVLLLIILGSISVVEINKLAKRETMNKRVLAALLTISFIVVTLMKVVSLFSTDNNQLFYIMPIAMGALLLKLFISERLAIIMAGIYAIIGTVIFNGLIPGALNIEAGIYFFFSQLAGIIFFPQVKDRLAILKAGLGIILVNILTVLLFLFLSFEKYTLIDFFLNSAYGLVSAFLAAVLTIGLLPFFETGLGILSDTRLLQLSSPNQPLLKKLLVEAPGTYHHSVMVANISETACEAIGANGLLARVGAYYHDIGKTVRPQFFIENQLSNQNPHDRMDPKESAKIIISHPYDGVEMLKENKLPKEIIEIAKSHHGTSLLKFFYYKEKEKNPDVQEEEFRYPGPKPQSKEAAVVSICDSVEAAVRSLSEPTEEKIEEIVAAIMSDKIADGQLDESPLTLTELKVIQRTICDSLKGFFHSRIQYPNREEK
ncbi:MULTISPECIES: HD family phosphohydrolase [Oceanobacillus]|uniref:Cyclic-di-AMP phosphodiesterase PgpH n=1 Tax=Oceanobacillus indicireducens TaxID=1004261 RepID=A0A917XVX7_9BACI|nr:HDIG domain-containing metalloprotein [Oceanobacillus indicireducens]GGN54608.1 cyclic-di-AMP phosphodiesterase PgpH [Oceanobacillus indicireducens]